MFKPKYLIGLALAAAVAAFCISVTKAEALNLPPISSVGGGTGTSTAPGYGQMFVGGKNGELEFVASSTIGGVNSIFGRKGAVTAQAGDYTTSLVTEGSNLYFTPTRVDAQIIASSSIPRFSPATYGKLFVSNGTAWTAVSTSTLGISALDLTGVLPVSKGGLNLSSAPAYGQIPVGTVSGGYSLTATTSLGLESPLDFRRAALPNWQRDLDAAGQHLAVRLPRLKRLDDIQREGFEHIAERLRAAVLQLRNGRCSPSAP